MRRFQYLCGIEVMKPIKLVIARRIGSLTRQFLGMGEVLQGITMFLLWRPKVTGGMVSLPMWTMLQGDSIEIIYLGVLSRAFGVMWSLLNQPVNLHCIWTESSLTQSLRRLNSLEQIFISVLQVFRLIQQTLIS